MEDLQDDDVEMQATPPSSQAQTPQANVIYAAPVEGVSEDMPIAATSSNDLGNVKGASSNLLRLVLRVGGFNRRKFLYAVVDGEEFTYTRKKTVRTWDRKNEVWVETVSETVITETPNVQTRMAAWDMIMKHGLAGSTPAGMAPNGAGMMPTIIKEVSRK